MCTADSASENHEGNPQDTVQPTSAYEALQQRAGGENSCAVQRNQHWIDKETAQDDFPFNQSDTVLVRVPRHCRSKLDPATIVGCVRSVYVTAVERRYHIATPAGILSRMLSGTDLAKPKEGMRVRQSDIDAVLSAWRRSACSTQCVAPLVERRQEQPCAATAEQCTRRPPDKWWCST